MSPAGAGHGPPDTPDPGGDGPADAVRSDLEALLLGGPRRYTRHDVARIAGIPVERTQRLWRALGFPDVAEDDRLFTDADVAAVSTVDQLIRTGFLDPGAEASIARAMGQSLSRLADWQTDMIAAALGPAPDDAPGHPRALQAAQALVPMLAALQDHVWRRHLAANADRLLLGVPGAGEVRELAVGFADLVGYTSRSRGMGGRELGAMIEDFESLAAEIIARHHGRIVKTVGDGVLFTAGSPVDAVEMALALPAGWTASDRPPLRVGLAHGRVLTRLGDVYSPVVNLASRLTSLAEPGTVLVDRQLAGLLRGHPGYRVRPLRRVSVRGYDRLRPWLVRRRAPDDDNVLEDLLDEIADDVLAEPADDDDG